VYAVVLLVPPPYWDPKTEEAAHVIQLAVPLLEQAAGGKVEGIADDTDPFAAVPESLERSAFDDLIISRLPHRVSRRLPGDPPARVERLGGPATVVTATQPERAWEPW
jgi:hypothetical protein